jgi:hypothetical protein
MAAFFMADFNIRNAFSRTVSLARIASLISLSTWDWRVIKKINRQDSQDLQD